MSDTSPDLLGSLSFLEDIPEEEGLDVSLMEADGRIRITVQGTDSQPDFNSLALNGQHHTMSRCVPAHRFGLETYNYFGLSRTIGRTMYWLCGFGVQICSDLHSSAAPQLLPACPLVLSRITWPIFSHLLSLFRYFSAGHSCIHALILTNLCKPSQTWRDCPCGERGSRARNASAKFATDLRR